MAGLLPVRPSVAAQWSGCAQIHQWNVQEVFTRRASEMRTVPRGDLFALLSKWRCRNVVGNCYTVRQEVAQSVGKNSLAGLINLPRVCGTICWCAQEVATAHTRRKRRNQNDGTHRAAWALQFVQWGELSSGRQAIEGAELAAHVRPVAACNSRIASSSPVFNLDEKTSSRNVRSARRGAAGGPSGTCDHLRPLLDSPRDLHALFSSRKSSPGSDEVLKDDRIAQEGRLCAGCCGRRGHPTSGVQDRPTVEDATVTSVTGSVRVTPFPGVPCCRGWSVFRADWWHHQLCVYFIWNPLHTFGKMRTVRSTQSTRWQAGCVRATPVFCGQARHVGGNTAKIAPRRFHSFWWCPSQRGSVRCTAFWSVGSHQDPSPFWKDTCGNQSGRISYL